MTPIVQPFFHADSNTWSYVVHAAGAADAAIIDAVLDFDAKSARTSTTSAQALVDYVAAHGLQPRWLLETHAHADHLSAAHWLKATHWPQARLAIGEGIRSVQKTGRLVVVDQSWPFASIASEVCTQIMERAFDYLDHQPVRVNTEDVPTPYAKGLEYAYLPNKDKIATAVNGRFVAAAARPATKLADGDRIEVVAPMQGG